MLSKAIRHEAKQVSNHCYEVKSCVSGKIYEVMLNGAKYSCSCERFLHKGDLCSHIYSVIFYEHNKILKKYLGW